MKQTFFIYKTTDNYGGCCDVASVPLDPEYCGNAATDAALMANINRYINARFGL